MVSNLKSELIRNNIVTRNELIKLYKPPIKKDQVPTENPFFTRQMVNYEPASQPVSTRNKYNLVDKDELVKSFGYQNLFGTSNTLGFNTATLSLQRGHTANVSHRYKTSNTSQRFNTANAS